MKVIPLLDLQFFYEMSDEAISFTIQEDKLFYSVAPNITRTLHFSLFLLSTNIYEEPTMCQAHSRRFTVVPLIYCFASGGFSYWGPEADDPPDVSSEGQW